VILKAREPARIMIAIGAEDRWHLRLAQRWIMQYNFEISDQRWGRMFVRICPYLPFSARICLNQEFRLKPARLKIAPARPREYAFFHPPQCTPTTLPILREMTGEPPFPPSVRQL
jgi:hypothetical protein